MDNKNQTQVFERGVYADNHDDAICGIPLYLSLNVLYILEGHKKGHSQCRLIKPSNGVDKHFDTGYANGPCTSVLDKTMVEWYAYLDKWPIKIKHRDSKDVCMQIVTMMQLRRSSLVRESERLIYVETEEDRAQPMLLITAGSKTIDQNRPIYT